MGRTPNHRLANAMGGLVPGVLAAIHCVGVAGVIFAGPGLALRPAGISIVLLSTAILALVVGLLSSFRSAFVFPSYIAAVVLVPTCKRIADELGARGDHAAFIPTFMATVATGTVMAGLFLLVLGRLRQSRAIRFVPYPIIGGFLGSAGWLLVTAGLGITTGVDIDFRELSKLVEGATIWHLAAGVAFAAILLLAQNRTKHFAVMPLVALAGTAAAHVVLLGMGQDLEAARVSSWLLPSYEADYSKIGPFFLEARIDWALVGQSLPSLLPIAVVNALVLMVHASAIEVVLDEDGDLDRELQVCGLGNLVAGLLGGTVGTTASGITAIAKQAGATNRSATIFFALTLSILLLIGSMVVPMIPTFVIGGLSLGIGLQFLKTWLWDARKTLALADYLVVVSMVVTVALLGFLGGLVLGLLIACVFFVFRYSQLEVVKHSLSGGSAESNLERAQEAKQALKRYGDQIYILELQGYIFFGTAHRVYETLRRHQQEARKTVHFLLLDLSKIIGMDSSAALSLGKLRRMVAKTEGALVLTGLSDDLRRLLEQARVIEDAPDVRVFPDRDRGLEWCEDQVLHDWLLDDEAKSGLGEQLERFLEPAMFERFTSYLQRTDLPANATIARQGEASDRMFFLAQGRVSVLGELEDGKTVRYRTFTKGTIVGELGLYTKSPRNASLVTDSDAVVYELSEQAFMRLRDEEPRLALALHEYVIEILAMRLRRLDGQVRDLLR